MSFVSAYRQGEGIQVNKGNGDGTISCLFVREGDPEWLEALLALSPEEAEQPTHHARTLEQQKYAAREGVSRVIGAVRSKFVTPMPAQDMIYLRKEAEGRSWLSATDPQLANYPFIQAELGITANTPEQVAQVWVNLSDMWVGIASTLENIRLSAISEIDASVTPSGVEAALQAFFTKLVPFS